MKRQVFQQRKSPDQSRKMLRFFFMSLALHAGIVLLLIETGGDIPPSQFRPVKGFNEDSLKRAGGKPPVSLHEARVKKSSVPVSKKQKPGVIPKNRGEITGSIEFQQPVAGPVKVMAVQVRPGGREKKSYASELNRKQIFSFRNLQSGLYDLTVKTQRKLHHFGRIRLNQGEALVLKLMMPKQAAFGTVRHLPLNKKIRTREFSQENTPEKTKKNGPEEFWRQFRDPRLSGADKIQGPEKVYSLKDMVDPGHIEHLSMRLLHYLMRSLTDFFRQMVQIFCV